jgi:chromosome partitioning protein
MKKSLQPIPPAPIMPRMLIAMVNSKGGVGKSTLAVHFGVWLHECGYRVVLLDCDLQRSSSQWMAEAEPAVRIVVLHSEDEVIEQAPILQQEADIVLADGPAGLKELTRALLLVCDLALVPCGPSVLDLRAASEAIRVVKQAQSIRGGAPQAKLLLNKVQPRYRLSRELQETSTSLDIPAVSHAVGLRQAYADAVGQGTVVWRMGGAAKAAAEELNALFLELMPRRDFKVVHGGRR